MTRTRWTIVIVLLLAILVTLGFFAFRNGFGTQSSANTTPSNSDWDFEIPCLFNCEEEMPKAPDGCVSPEPAAEPGYVNTYFSQFSCWVKDVDPAYEVPANDVNPVAPVVAITSVKSDLEVESVVEAGGTLKVIFSATNTTDATSFKLYAPDKTTVLLSDLKPEQEFELVVPTDVELGSGKILAYVRAENADGTASEYAQVTSNVIAAREGDSAPVSNDEPFVKLTLEAVQGESVLQDSTMYAALNGSFYATYEFAGVTCDKGWTTTEKYEISAGDSPVATAPLVSGQKVKITMFAREGFPIFRECQAPNGVAVKSNEFTVIVDDARVQSLSAAPAANANANATENFVTYENGTVTGSWNGATFTITGVVEHVTPYKVFRPGDEYGTEVTYQGQESIVFGGPGVETNEDCKLADESVSIECTERPNVQTTFYGLISPQTPFTTHVREGSEQGPGHTLITWAGGDLAFDGITMSIDTPTPIAAHNWFTGYENPALSTPEDGNLDITVTRGHSSYVMSTIMPPGQRINEKYRADQAIAAIEKECGNDGCVEGVIEFHYRAQDKTVTIQFVYADGTVEQIYTNWK